jgi:hypothetical protein
VTVEGGRSNACFLISKDAMQALFHSQDPAVQVLLAPLRGASGVQPTFPGALRAGPLARRRRARMVARGERAISEPPLVIGQTRSAPR